MKEYEIVAKFLNGCAGAAHPQTYFEEAELSSTDDFVRTKHGKDFDKFVKETNENGQIIGGAKLRFLKIYNSTKQGSFRACRPRITAVSSIRLLVVEPSPPESSFSTP